MRPRKQNFGIIARKVDMKENALLVLFFCVVIVVASPLTLLADKMEDRYKHASDLLSQGDFQGAQTEFEAIIQKKHNYRSAKVLLGMTLTKLSEQSEKQGDRTRAVAQLREALGLDPDEAYWHSALAKLLHAQGDADEAMKECSQAAQLSPDDSGLAGGCGLGARGEINKKGGTDPKVPAGVQPSKVGGLVTAPVPIKKPDPSHSEKARSARLQGTTVLWLVVDAQGDVEQEAIVKPLGLGLDEKALSTVRTWKFKPATRSGTPVPVRVMVEVSFRLF
jgi:TonB family protein